MSGRILPAGANDALHVAAIVDIAGHGIDLESWIKNSGDDHAVLDAARRAASEDPNSPYHFSKAYLIEVEGVIAGGLVGELISQNEDYAAEISPALAPLVALETRLIGYWSILGVAVYSEFRGKGLAAKLIHHADEVARNVGRRGCVLSSKTPTFRQFPSTRDWASPLPTVCPGSPMVAGADRANG